MSDGDVVGGAREDEVQTRREVADATETGTRGEGEVVYAGEAGGRKGEEEDASLREVGHKSRLLGPITIYEGAAMDVAAIDGLGRPGRMT